MRANSFWFESIWLQDLTFKSMVENILQKYEDKGWEGYKFMKNLQHVKEKLKTWKRKVFGTVRIRKNEILEEIKKF